ncbi:MAG: methyltransferase domain-containing protein [Candidatus Dadabacteria bacterium]|nr:methyltransferase domain-containing protein [Candidatus Dadabacteria bacterium]NIQ14021.1 methyltransferase domain-containing protein [Candidatus Dadabacteria bacterium]
MGDQIESAKDVHNLIKKHNPEAKNLLELACGTGSYLKYLSNYYNVCGLDTSSLMLSIANQKTKKTPLFQANMVNFKFDHSYDAIICMNDSINHLLKKSEWKKLFLNVSEHLNKNGIFIFDINTKFKLDNLNNSGPIVHEFDGNLFITSVVKKRVNNYEWNLKVFEEIKNDQYRLHEETLYESAFTVKEIKEILKNYFKKIKTYDLDTKKVSIKSQRIHFVCTKK